MPSSPFSFRSTEGYVEVDSCNGLALHAARSMMVTIMQDSEGEFYDFYSCRGFFYVFSKAFVGLSRLASVVIMIACHLD
jgi:hypothetical protein